MDEDRDKLLAFMGADLSLVAFRIAYVRIMRKFHPEITQKILLIYRSGYNVHDGIYRKIRHIPQPFLKDICSEPEVLERTQKCQHMEPCMMESLPNTLALGCLTTVFYRIVVRLHERLTREIKELKGQLKEKEELLRIMKINWLGIDYLTSITAPQERMEEMRKEMKDVYERQRIRVEEEGDLLYESILSLGKEKIREFNETVKVLIGLNNPWAKI